MSNEGILLESGTNEVEVLEFLLGGQYARSERAKGPGHRAVRPRTRHPHPAGPPCPSPARCSSAITASPWSTSKRSSPAGPAMRRLFGAGPTAVEHARGDCRRGAARSSTGIRIQPHRRRGKRKRRPPSSCWSWSSTTSKTAFLVDGVNRIHRVSWDEDQPAQRLPGHPPSSKFTGSACRSTGREILLVDMEKVVDRDPARVSRHAFRCPNA
jgi:hypothetical protein